MAGKAVTTIYKVFALIAAVFVDLSLFYASGLVVFHGALGHFAHLWISAALRWSGVTVVTLLLLGDLEPLLIRFITAYSLLPAVFGTGTRALYREESQCGPAADVRCWLMFAGASLGAALFWEITVPDSDEEAGSKEQKQKSRVLFMRVLHMYKPDYPLLFGGFVFLSLAVICEMFIPFYVGRVIDILGSQYQQTEFFTALLFMGLYSVGSSVSAGCRGGVLLCAISSFTCRIKVKLFEALTKQEIGFFENVKTGEITSRLSKDTTLTGRTVCLNVNVMLRTFIKTMGMISLMMSLSWKLTFLVLMETPITGLMQNLYDTHYQVTIVERAREGELVERHRATITERSIKLLLIKEIKHYILVVSQSNPIKAHLTVLLWIIAQLPDTKIVIFQTLTYIFGDMLNSVMAAGKVFEYIDRKPKVSTDGKLKPEQLKGRISYCGLNFAYPSNPDKTVLLELKPDQVTALVGPSGEGKSTCVSLLQRLYEPQQGEILLDGEPLKSYDHHFFHKKVLEKLVSQEPVLFSGSIRDNITYGFPNCSMEQIEEAARKANAHDFINQLEKGYDTEVGESGGQLSKSERQRIGIARALVREPKVIILDEITSSLDVESENKVLQALASCPDQTLLVIAHRLKTIEKADQIIVVRGGRVEEKGTHQELMEQQGSYHKLINELFD
uniref:Transporter associated with antigen processing, subunit type a n=1 Tax=Fundulus heteroclitus TaxID=8078 RepID=A0A3Q2QJJ1_FUNHE